MPPSPPSLLSRRLLDRLRPYGSQAADGSGGIHTLGAGLFTYRAIVWERLARIRLDHPVIGIVLDGAKEVWFGAAMRRLRAGDVFVLPGQVDLHVVNSPDGSSGSYQSLLLEVRGLPASLRGVPLKPKSAPFDLDVRVPLTGDLVDALVHATSALAGSGHAELLADHRLGEVLLLLRDVGAARPLFGVGLPDRIRWLVATEADRDITATAVAAKLGLSPPTLRRRLAEAGLSFRRLAIETRMQVARDFLLSGEGTVTQAAEAAGYASRSHFARHFRRAFGHVPRQALMRAADGPRAAGD
jgi:AraC-like DNA-binding protein